MILLVIPLDFLLLNQETCCVPNLLKNIQRISLKDFNLLSVGVFNIEFYLNNHKHILNEEIHYVIEVLSELNVMDDLDSSVGVTVLGEGVHWGRLGDDGDGFFRILVQLNYGKLLILNASDIFLHQHVLTFDERFDVDGFHSHFFSKPLGEYGIPLFATLRYLKPFYRNFLIGFEIIAIEL